MGGSMRRLLSIDCWGARVGASLDGAVGSTGILLVTGGSQTRIGSHRMYERLAAGLAEAGHPCLRFDRRGVGDSEGDDPGFRGSGPDIEAATAAFRREVPGLRRIFGLGLCDGATALALYGAQSDLQGLLLVNPWFVEAESGEPAPAAVRHHYRRRLLSREGWRKLLTGSISWRKLLKGLAKSAGGRSSPLAAEVAMALREGAIPAELLLAKGDATAIAALHEAGKPQFKGLLAEPQLVSSDSHTFARPGDMAALLSASLAAIRRLEGPPRR